MHENVGEYAQVRTGGNVPVYKEEHLCVCSGGACVLACACVRHEQEQSACVACKWSM